MGTEIMNDARGLDTTGDAASNEKRVFWADVGRNSRLWVGN